MTTQRLVRGNKARIIASLCAVIFCIGLLTLFQKNQNELENIKRNYESCIQQQESLQTQLQVIADYKSRLEKSLQAEKSEHKQTRVELEARINDEKSRRDKTSMEANLRFTSLQQHYKLLQTKHDDLKEQSEKLQQQYLEETDKLQAKVKELQEQFKQTEKDKNKSIEHLKTTYMQLQIDKMKLEEQLKNSEKDHEKWQSDVDHLTKENHQLLRELDSAKVPKRTNIQAKHEETITAPEQNIADSTQNVTQRSKPVSNKQIENDAQNGPQNVVLQKPSNFSKSTTKTTSVSKGNLQNAKPLLIPTVTPSNKKIERAVDNVNVLQPPNLAFKKIPPGVVPIPRQEVKNDEKNNIPDEINFALPNRYRNNIIESELVNEIIKETKVDAKVQNEPEVNLGDQNQQDNAAMEVMDQKNPAQEDPLHLNEDVKLQDFKDPILQLAENRKMKKHNDLLRAAVDNGALKAPPGHGAFEAEGDYDKDGQKEDLQIEEAEPEAEEDDDDDYDQHLAGRQKEPAVRN